MLSEWCGQLTTVWLSLCQPAELMTGLTLRVTKRYKNKMIAWKDLRQLEHIILTAVLFAKLAGMHFSWFASDLDNVRELEVIGEVETFDRRELDWWIQYDVAHAARQIKLVWAVQHPSGTFTSVLFAPHLCFVAFSVIIRPRWFGDSRDCTNQRFFCRFDKFHAARRRRKSFFLTVTGSDFDFIPNSKSWWRNVFPSLLWCRNSCAVLRFHRDW